MVSPTENIALSTPVSAVRGRVLVRTTLPVPLSPIVSTAVAGGIRTEGADDVAQACLGHRGISAFRVQSHLTSSPCLKAAGTPTSNPCGCSAKN